MSLATYYNFTYKGIFPPRCHAVVVEHRCSKIKCNPNALNIPGVVWVPEQKGLFEDQEERQRLYGDYSFGDAVLDTTLGIISEIFTPKKKSKKK